MPVGGPSIGFHRRVRRRHTRPLPSTDRNAADHGAGDVRNPTAQTALLAVRSSCDDSRVCTVDLYGRATELATVRSLIERAREGAGGAMVVRGPAGIGKTSLLDAARTLAEPDDTLILTAAGVAAERRLPFAGLHQVLRPLMAGLAGLAHPQRSAIEAAFGAGDTAAPDLFRIALATLDLLVDAGHDRPLLLLADDADCLDRPTQDVLGFVARRLASERVALLLAVRDGAADPFAQAGLPELRLPPLAEEAAVELLSATAPALDPAARRSVLDTASGNPLGLVELASDPAALLGEPPTPDHRLTLTARLERSFAARLPDLPATTRTLLLVLAADTGCSLAEALHATALVRGAPAEIDAVDPAVAAQLVEVDEQAQPRFRHPLIGSAVHQAATLAERVAVHAALAQVVADQPDRSAWHSAAAVIGPDDEVADRLEAAATRAQRRGAVAIAVAALERAGQLRTDPRRRAGLLLRAAETAIELGRRYAAELLSEVAGASLPQLDRARSLLVAETIDLAARPDPQRIRALVDAAGQARRAGDDELAISLLWAAATRCMWTSPAEPERSLVGRAAAELGAPASNARLLAILAYTDPVGRGELVAQVLAQSSTMGDATAVRLLGSAAFAVADFHAAAAFVAEAAAAHRAQGRLGQLARTLSILAWSAVFTGDWDRARTAADESARLAAETGALDWHGPAEGVQAILAAYRGEADAADRLALDIQRREPPAGSLRQHYMTQLIRGVAAIGAGRHGDAFAHLRRIFDPADPAHHYCMRFSTLAPLAEAAAHSGDVDEARAIVESHEGLAARTPAPFFHVGMRYARAVLADDADATPRFDEALRANLSRWPMERGRLLLAHGSWLRRRRRIAESRAPLRAARDAFDALGARPWGDRARDELRASGEASKEQSPPARSALSPQELHIAQLAAAGLTNRQIGQQLYLSHRTVGSHLYRLFPKLGITSRAQLTAALAAPERQ